MVTLRALGNCIIETSETSISPSQEILFATALFLILERHRKLTRDSVEAIIWPQSRHSSSAHHRMRQTLLKLRQAGVPVVRDQGFIRIDDDVHTDFDAFLLEPTPQDDGSLPTSFLVLPEYCPSVSSELAHWVDEKRRQVTAGLIPKLLVQIRQAHSRAEWTRVEDLTRTCLEVDPFNEEAVLARAESVAMRGGKAEAVTLLDAYLADLGGSSNDLRIPPSIMRRRISERFQPAGYPRGAEFVGRGSTMEILAAMLRRARAGKGEAAILSGPAGIGKTKVLDEFAGFAILQGACVQRAISQPSDRNRPLSVFTDLTPTLLDMRGAIGCSGETIATLTALTPSQQVGPNGDIETELVYPRIRGALIDILDAVSDEQTIVICLDNVQWMDAVSSRLVDELTRWCQSHKVLLLLTWRTSANLQSPSDEWPNTTRLELEGFDLNTSRQLFDQLTSRTGTPSESFRNNAVITAGGNPFFLHQIARQWTETREESNPPSSIELVLKERTSRLSANGLLVLQACSVLGKYSTLARIERMLELKAFELVSAIDELGKASMIQIQRDAGVSTESLCPHDLLATSVLTRLSSSAHAYLHRRAGMALEVELDTEPPSILWDCANHWHLAGDSRKAISLVITCARHMLKIGLYREASRMFERAVELAATADERFQIKTELLGALKLAGDWTAVRETSAELARSKAKVCCEADNGHNEFELTQFDARWRSTVNWHDLLRDVDVCINAADACVNHRLAAGVLGLKLAANLGARKELADIYSTLSDLYGHPDADPLLRLESEMIYNGDSGDLDSACSAAEQHVAQTKLTGSALTIVDAMRNAALVFRRAGADGKVRNIVREAHTLSVANKLYRQASLIALFFVEVMLDAGNVLEAQDWYDKVDESLFAADTHTKAEYRFHAARLALITDDVERASHLFRSYSELIIDDSNPRRRLSAQALRVFIHMAQRAPAEKLTPLLDDMQRTDLVISKSGGQDFEIAALVSGLRYVGRGEQAMDFLRVYRSGLRRDRGPFGIELVKTFDQ